MAEEFRWPAELELGILQIDNDHREIFRQFYVLNEMATGARSQGDFHKVAKRLREWSGYHFSHEEALMKKLGYAEVELHRLEHSKFISQISRFIKLYRPGISGTIVMFHQICHKWYHKHLETMDRPLVAFVQSCDSQATEKAFTTTFRKFFERDRPDRQALDGNKTWLG